MTSQINYLGINENFPVAGVDNDTQVFRDNFDTIKTSLRYAKDEITVLQDNTAKITESNDFGLNNLSNALIQNFRKQKVPLNNITENVTIDYQQGYHFFGIANSSVNIEFQNFPGDPTIVPASQATIGYGKATLELYSDVISTVAATAITSGNWYTIDTLGTSTWTGFGGIFEYDGAFVINKEYIISSLGTTTQKQWNDIAGTVGVTYLVGSSFTARISGTGDGVTVTLGRAVRRTFLATGTGSGTGTAYPVRVITFTVSSGTNIKKNKDFPVLTSTGSTVSVGLTYVNKDNPLIFEVWRHASNNIFINSLGTFS